MAAIQNKNGDFGAAVVSFAKKKKKKKNYCIESGPRPWTFRSYPNLSPLHLDYNMEHRPAKVRQIQVHKLAYCFFVHQQRVTLALSVTFDVNSTWASTLFSLRL